MIPYIDQNERCSNMIAIHPKQEQRHDTIHNRQPWEFVVVTDAAKADMLEAMQKGLEREKVNPILPYSAKHIKAAEYTLSIMEQAPVVILIVNPLGMAIELGLGSLWVCDTYFAYRELKDWLHTDGELFAALVVGYADETPSARPRKPMETAVIWRKE